MSGIPPQVLAALQAQQGGGAPPGMPPGAVGGPQGPSGDNNDHPAIQYLKQALQSLRQYEGAESDPEDKAVAAKVYALLTQLLAKDQQQADAATGASPAVKYLRTANQGGPVGR